MKKFKGLLAMVVALAMVCTGVLSVAAEVEYYGVATTSAVSGAFVDLDPVQYSWCVDEINAMVADGIIKGRGNGIFDPESTVTKLESLVLASRILGFTKDVNIDLVAKGKEMYEEKVAAYELSYGTDEICYLLLKGIIFENELDDYLADGAANEGMKRYEVAVLLTKAAGAEADVKSSIATPLNYNDVAEIPTSSRKYVGYVTKVGLMQGMGDNVFAPVNNVTRAQMALVLYRLRDKTGYDTFKGIVANYDVSTATIRFKLEDNTDKRYKIIADRVVLRCDGEEIEHTEIETGWEALVTIDTADDTLVYIDFLTTQSDGLVSGRLLSKTTSSGTTTMKIESVTAAGGKETVSYKVSDNVVVTFNDKESSLRDIETGDYVKLTIKNREIIVVAASDSKKTVKGTVTAIDFTEGVSLTIKVKDEEEVYFLSSNVKVAKNDDTANIKDILIGDKVTLTLEYNVITKIDATSTTTTDTGVIQGISITTNGTIVSIRIGSNVYEYPVARDVEVLLDGEKGTIYDLRVNSTATIKMESDSIVKIETMPVVEEADIKGEVVAVNEAYKLVKIKVTDNISGTEVEEMVFVKDNAKIISTSSITDKKFKDIQLGQIITAMGTRSASGFEATTIVIR